MDLPSWHVVPGSTRQTSQLKPGGAGFTDMEEITYMIDSGPAVGQERTIRVPSTQYNADSVKAAVTADLSNTHGVNTLNG